MVNYAAAASDHKMRQYNRTAHLRSRRPFWLPASNYYVLAVAASLTFFFLAWGILNDAGEETPWITAGIGASILLFGAVIFRELVLRRVRSRFIRRETILDRQMNEVYSRIETMRPADKLTIERNATLISEIRRKSEAAKVLGKFSAGHREVFELCESYLATNERELKHIGTGSPRLGPLRKGRDTAVRHHHYHLLKWAEIETGSLNQLAKGESGLDEKVEAARNAVGVIDYALNYYPHERSLLDSRDVLTEMIISIEVSGIVEEAERAAFQGDIKRARVHYRDALFRLGRDNAYSESRQLAAERIAIEMERLDRSEGDGPNGAN